MELFKNVLIEDLEVYKKSLNENQFHFCNIISNRITINSVILNSKEFALIGAILKDFLPLLQLLEESVLKKAIRTLNNTIDGFVQSKDDLNPLIIIEKYSEFFDTFRQYFNSPIESYKENKDYTSKLVDYCLEFLIKDLETDIIPLSQDIVVSGVTGEISRSSKNFGCASHQLMLQLILSFYGRLQDYFKELILSEESDQEKKWDLQYKTFKKRLINNLKIYEISDSYIEKSTDFLFDIIKEWRYMFMRLMNILPLIQRKKVEIPSDIEKELKEMVSHTVSEKIEGDKK